MKIRAGFPHAVREIEHLWIPLRDGCRLAARMWLPERAERAPVPAVVEYIPYGKRIGTRERDRASAIARAVGDPPGALPLASLGARGNGAAVSSSALADGPLRVTHSPRDRRPTGVRAGTEPMSGGR